MFARRLLLPRIAVLPGIAAAAAVLLVAAPAMALPGFGTAPVSGGGSGSTPTTGISGVSSVSVGHHPGYDRVVFTLAGGMPHFEAGYVAGVTQDGSGAPVPLLGSASLLVMFKGTTVGASVQNTVTPGLPMLKQVKGAGDFEAHTSYGIGAASRSGFRAFTLTGPNRLVIDLAIPAASGTGTGTGGSGSGSGTGGSGGGLANTGASHTVPLTIGGLGLVGLGGLGLWLTRRRWAAA
jgi:LPXTG-motif cell wall-anchored protein